LQTIFWCFKAFSGAIKGFFEAIKRFSGVSNDFLMRSNVSLEFQTIF